jgi:hypothetical protein
VVKPLVAELLLGKHERHGVNLQVIVSPDGTILWVSGQLPGSAHDTAAARVWNILAALRDAGLIALATRAITDTTRPDHVITPQGTEETAIAERRQPRSRSPPRPLRTCQRPTQDILHKLRASPHRAGLLAEAIHVLQNYEVAAG